MKKWIKRICGIAVAVLLLFAVIGNPIVQKKVSELSAGFVKTVLTVGLSNAVYASTPDYVVDGTDDDVQVQIALEHLPYTGGKIILFGGNYNFSATVSRAISNITIEGSGKATHIAYNASTPLISVGSQTGWVIKNIATDAGWFTLASDTIVDSCWNNEVLTYVGGDSHSNRSVLDATQESFTTTLKTAYDWEVNNITSGWKESVDSHSGNTSNPHGVTKSQVGLGDVPNLDTTDAVNNQHTHSNKSTLDNIQEAFTTSLKTSYDWLVTNITSAWKTTVDNFVASKGSASGLAPLDSASKVPTVNLGGSGASGSTYLRGDQTWATPSSSPPDYSATIDLYDEFVAGLLTSGNIGTLGWSFLTTAPSYQASVANHLGIRRMATSGTINTVNAFYLGSAANNDNIQYGDLCDFTFIVRISDITTMAAFVGAMDAMTTAVGNQDRYGFSFIAGTDTYWMMTTGIGSVSTRTATDITVVANTWYKLRVVRTATGVDYYINGVSKGSVTTNLPDTALSFGFHVQTLAASARYLDCDFFRMTLGVTR